MAVAKCPNCGKETTPGTQFCIHCGAPIQAAPPPPPTYYAAPPQAGGLPVNRKSRTTAAVLAILLGGLGLHKFYLGQAVMGILYIVFSWTFIPMILGLIEGIIYLTTSEEAFYAKYH